MAVILSMLDCGLNQLLDRRIDEPGRELTVLTEVGRDELAANGLPDELGQQDGVASGSGSFAQSLQDGNAVADGNPLAQQILEDTLNAGERKQLGNQVFHYLGIVDSYAVKQFLGLLPGE